MSNNKLAIYSCNLYDEIDKLHNTQKVLDLYPDTFPKHDELTKQRMARYLTDVSNLIRNLENAHQELIHELYKNTGEYHDTA